MKKTKIFEWLGWLIVMASIWSNAQIRSSSNSNNIWLNVTVAGMAMGAAITFVASFIGRRNS